MKKTAKAFAFLGSLGVLTSAGSITAFASDSTTATQGDATGAALFSTLILPILCLVFLYFILIRPQQKQDKETREMQKNLQVGDEVVTIGGIVGIVLRVENNTETVIIETGSDRLKIRLKQDAIRENVTARELAAAEKAEKEKKKLANNPISTGKPKDE
ncbi:MAG: preprotein translocase subunit YajC [Oscillospiraceae bacterium]